ncbi:hypothetical protein [Jiulongibacter sediminis]|uniref:hypothetical protein n=1 Tax=Jiulongibacter sediminis TaxID=1605367 RepID=UPI0026ED704C|nr:hypothetical protein [Jiulongibacter sediminis]
MEKLSVVILLLVVFNSCTKMEVLSADQVSGNYDVVFIEASVGNSNVPIQGNNSTIDFELTLTKVSDTFVDFQMSQLTTTGGSTNIEKAGAAMELSESMSGVIDFSVGTNKVATFENGTLRFSSTLGGEDITFVY